MNNRKLRVEVKLRNARLFNEIFANYKSVNDFCVKKGFMPTAVGEYINLKNSPFMVSGEYKKSAIDIANALWCDVEDLFPKEIYNLSKTSGSIDIEPMSTWLVDSLTPEKIALENNAKEIVESLISKLPKRSATIIRKRYWDGKTLDSVAKDMGLTRSRISQIENKAIKTMRRENYTELRIAMSEMEEVYA